MGIDVWRDRGELRGGDSWDETIRREIRECALFVPVISRNAAARLEGYFRLEWTLADERVRMMARDRVFIVPVCIDATRDAGAPESFLRAQWTRLDAGAVPPEFAARIRALLDRLDAPTPTPADPFHAPASASPDRTAGAPERPAAAARSPRVAVLPFADMSASRDQEYFCAGTAEEVTNALARVRGLQVASRSAAFRFKDHVLHPSEIGRLLNVSALLQGSVRKMDARVRVSAQLVDTADGFTLWSETYDRELRDIFAVQEDIARHVVAALKVRLLQGEAGLLQWRGTLESAGLRILPARTATAEQGEGGRATCGRGALPRVDPARPEFAYAYAGLADVLTHIAAGPERGQRRNRRRHARRERARHRARSRSCGCPCGERQRPATRVARRGRGGGVSARTAARPSSLSCALLVREVLGEPRRARGRGATLRARLRNPARRLPAR